MGLCPVPAAADAPSEKPAEARRVRKERREPGLLGRLPADITVRAVGTYKGTTPLPKVKLDRSDNATTQAHVIVNLPGESVVLVLTAYDPTVWRVGRTPGTQIAGALVSGYHGQAIVGVDRKTPIAVSSHEAGGPFQPFYAYKASRKLLAMNQAVKRLVGEEIEHFTYRATRDVFYVGEPPAAEDADKVVYSDELKVEEFAFVAPVPGGGAQPAAGQDGIAQLIKEGKLRHATPEDIEAWVDKASEPYKRFNPELRVDPPSGMRHGRAYVILKPLTLPDGLHGAHSATFLLPEGVPFPDGPEGHNRFYRMDGTAEGKMAAMMMRGDD